MGNHLQIYASTRILVDEMFIIINNFSAETAEFQLREDVQAVNERIVLDRNIITSSNPATAFDVAFMLLKILTSAENTKQVKELMGFNE